MAISILSSPATYEFAYDLDSSNLTYVISSDNLSLYGFRYVADIYTDDTFRSRQIFDPNEAGGLCSVKIGTVLGNYVSRQNILQDIGGVTASPESFSSYYVVFRELSDGTTGGTGASFSVGATGYTSSTGYIWYGCRQYENTAGATAYVISNSSNNVLLLTSQPGRTDAGASGASAPDMQDMLPVRIGDQAFLSNVATAEIFNHGTGAGNYVRVTTFDYSGTTASYYYCGSTGSRFTTFGIGPQNLNYGATAYQLSGSSYIGYTGPVVTENTLYYSVQVIRLASNGSVFSTPSSAYWYKVLPCADSRYNTYRLTWINELGGWDSYTFNMRDQRKYGISRSEFTSLYGSLQSDNSFGYTQGKRGMTQFDARVTQDFTVWSDWMTEDEVLWISNLYWSPAVYLTSTNPTGATGFSVTWDPVVITDSEFIERDRKGPSRRPLAYQVSFRKAYSKVTQRG